MVMEKKRISKTHSVFFSWEDRQMLGNVKPGTESVLNDNCYRHDLWRMFNTFWDFESTTMQFVTSQKLFDKAGSFFKELEFGICWH